MTDQEIQAGMILNDSQLGVLHNMRTDIAEQKLNLDFTPNDIGSYTQQEAFLSGQLKLLGHLIDASESSKKEVLEAARQSNQQ